MSETAIQNLPGVTLDPKDESGLEAAFGVTSNAEELVRQNRARYTKEHRAALVKSVNPELSERVQAREEFDPEKSQYGFASGPVEGQVADHVGHEVLTAVVRGSGRNAVISYTYVGDRGSIEKNIVPFVEVFGTDKQRRDAAKPASRTPRAAADAVLQEHEDEAQAKIRAAQRDAQAKLDEARAEAEKVLADAQAEAAKIRAEAAEEAQQAAADAEDGDDENAAKKQAARKSGGSKRSGGGRKASSSKRSG